jgi:hypothetical protein
MLVYINELSKSVKLTTLEPESTEDSKTLTLMQVDLMNGEKQFFDLPSPSKRALKPAFSQSL